MGRVAEEVHDQAPALSALAGDCVAIGHWMLKQASLDDRLAGSVPFCTMCAVTIAGWQLVRQLRAVEAGQSPELAATKPVTVRFFLDHIVSETAGLRGAAMAGAELLYVLSADQLAG